MIGLNVYNKNNRKKPQKFGGLKKSITFASEK